MISKEFVENAIFSEWFSVIFEVSGEPDKDFIELMEALPEYFSIRIDLILQIIDKLRMGNYTEARKSLGIRDDYHYYSKDISMLRYNIKSLLSGLIKTSSINDISEIKDLVNLYGNSSGSDWDSPAFQHLLRELKNVATLNDLSKFNAYFKNYLVGMVIELLALFHKRITYTIQYLRENNSMVKACNDLSVHSEKLREELEKLKAIPDSINDGILEI